jgi:hypothetical protein
MTQRTSTDDDEFDLREYLNIGNILRRRGVVTDKQVEKAVQVQMKRGGKIGEVLVALGYCTSEAVHYALQEQERHRMPEGKSDDALERLEAAVDTFEQSTKKLSTLTMKRVEVMDVSDDQSGAVPISPGTDERMLG